ncbi:hypothetical protein AB0G51_34360 [Streptomyces asoensis]|uniref:hypothetical protein n=1 Tax=Streptomyces asoensis TaxID=249586 RepID=UPI0033E6475E
MTSSPNSPDRAWVLEATIRTAPAADPQVDTGVGLVSELGPFGVGGRVRELPEPDRLKGLSFVQRYEPIAGRLRTALDARPARRN